MDPKLTKEERKMQEELLRHEFPFDEKAWASMEVLLDRDKGKPGAGLPPAPQDSIPGPSRNWGLLLMLLISAGLGAASVAWWNVKETTNTLSTVNHPNRAIGASKQTSQETNLDPAATINPSPEAATELTAVPVSNYTTGPSAEVENPSSDLNTPKGQNTLSNQPNSSTKPKLANHKTVNASQALANTRTSNQQKEATDPAFQPSLEKPVSTPKGSNLQKDAIKAAGSLPETATLPVSKEAAAEEKAPEMDQNQAETLDLKQFLDLSNLFIWPPSPVTSLARKLQQDSLVRPVKRENAAIKRWERGWILGANANAVDYHPLRMSVLPHLGYFANYRIRPNTVLQAELVAKYVSGYKLHAAFMDIIPGGSSQVILNTNNLLYLELPLIYKQQYKPGKSWLLGIKPSGNVKLFSSGLTSYTNFAPLRTEDSQNGIRYFDLGLVFGWEWRYGKNWALDIRYNQGLLDLTYDQFYRDQSTHLNSDLQVSLRYSIHPKSRRHAPKTLFPTPPGK